MMCSGALAKRDNHCNSSVDKAFQDILLNREMVVANGREPVSELGKDEAHTVLRTRAVFSVSSRLRVSNLRRLQLLRVN